jgi:hypothetical protein
LTVVFRSYGHAEGTESQKGETGATDGTSGRGPLGSGPVAEETLRLQAPGCSVLCWENLVVRLTASMPFLMAYWRCG